uniref:Uncharacterized protein n=1 Tax=Gorilla gorilla gorilla TaxID=9595 RepID=A0A2I2ZBI5_GORGO
MLHNCLLKERVITREASSCFLIKACSQASGEMALMVELASAGRLTEPGLCLPHFMSLPEVFGVLPVIAEMSEDCFRKSGLLLGNVPQLLTALVIWTPLKDKERGWEKSAFHPSPSGPSWMQLQLCSWLSYGWQ